MTMPGAGGDPKSIIVKLQPIERPTNYQRCREQKWGITKYAISVEPFGISMEPKRTQMSEKIHKLNQWEKSPPLLVWRALSLLSF